MPDVVEACLRAEKSPPRTLEDVISAYLEMCARDNARPNVGDPTYRSMFSAELAARIRKSGVA